MLFRSISCGSGVLIDDRIYPVIPGPRRFPDVKSLGFHVLVLSLPTQIQDAPDAYIPQLIDGFTTSFLSFYLVALSFVWTY